MLLKIKYPQGLSAEFKRIDVVMALNGNSSKLMRTRVLAALMDPLSSVRVVVATSVLAMGVDVSGKCITLP